MEIFYSKRRHDVKKTQFIVAYRKHTGFRDIDDILKNPLTNKLSISDSERYFYAQHA
jgi:hypothetical protein